MRENNSQASETILSFDVLWMHEAIRGIGGRRFVDWWLWSSAATTCGDFGRDEAGYARAVAGPG